MHQKSKEKLHIDTIIFGSKMNKNLLYSQIFIMQAETASNNDLLSLHGVDAVSDSLPGNRH